MKTFFKHENAVMRQYSYYNWLMAILLFFVCTLSSEAQVKEWDRTFGGSGNDFPHEIYQTDDGGYLVVGYSQSGATGDKSEAGSGIWVVKLYANGSIEWEKTFAINNTHTIVSTQRTKDGGYIIAGYTNPYFDVNIPQNDDYWVLKMDVNGNTQWEKTFGGSGADQLAVLLQTDDGGYLMGGTSNSGVSGDKSEPSRGWTDYWVVKLDANGTKVWDKTIGSNGQDVLTAVEQTGDGGYVVGGYSWSGPSGDRTGPFRGEYDYWVVKLNASGAIEWDNAFGGVMVDLLYSLQQTSDGGYILGGPSQSNVGGDKSEPNWDQCPSQPGGCSHDYWVVKLDANGHKEWDKTIGGTGSDVLFHVRQTPDGGYILGGYSYSGISGDKTEVSRGEADYWIVKLDSFGNKQWDKTLGTTESESTLSFLELTSDGGYILGGPSSAGISGDKSEASRGGSDYWIIKLGPDEPCTTPSPSITVIPTSDVYTGDDPATIYLGYGPQSVRLQASGGTTYSWSPTAGLSSTTVANPIFTPTAPGSYTFTVTAYNGACSATAAVTITVVDVRCGNGKVRLCHNGQELCLPSAAVANHLRQHAGDRLGDCQTGVGYPMALRVHPNPSSSRAQVEFSLAADDRYRLELYSAGGKMLGVVAEGRARSGQVVSLELKGEKLREGMYYLRLITSDEVQTTRLVVKK